MTIPHVGYGADAKSAEQNALIDQCNATTTQTDQQQATIDAAAITIGQHDQRLTGLETAPAPALDDLADVTAPAPTAGQAVTWDGAGWVNAAPAPAAHTHQIGTLTDVDVTTPPAAGQVLKWNGTRWAPATDQTAEAGSGATHLDELTDVDLTSTAPANGNALVFNSAAAQWLPRPQQAAGQYFGHRTAPGGAARGITVTNAGAGSPGNAGIKHTDIGTPVGTPVGCSMSAGTFTPTYAGKWHFSTSAQFEGANTAVRALYLALSSAANSPSGVRYALLGVPQADALNTGVVLPLGANQSVSVYVAVWTTNASVYVWKAQGNALTATWLGPL